MNPHDGMSPGDPLGDMLRAWSGMVNAALPPPRRWANSWAAAVPRAAARRAT